MYLGELKKHLLKSRSIDDVILAILSFCPSNFLLRKHELFYIIFNEIKEETKIKEIKKLVFDESPILPYCEQLEASFFRIEYIVQYIKKNKQNFFVINDVNHQLMKARSKFNDEEQKELWKIFELLDKSIEIYAHNGEKNEIDLPIDQTGSVQIFTKIKQFYCGNICN